MDGWHMDWMGSVRLLPWLGGSLSLSLPGGAVDVGPRVPQVPGHGDGLGNGLAWRAHSYEPYLLRFDFTFDCCRACSTTVHVSWLLAPCPAPTSLRPSARQDRGRGAVPVSIRSQHGNTSTSHLEHSLNDTRAPPPPRPRREKTAAAAPASASSEAASSHGGPHNVTSAWGRS